MNKHRPFGMFLGFAAMATVAGPMAAGCVASETDADMVTEDAFDITLATMSGPDDPDPPPIGHNPFPTACFWNHGTQRTYRDLANAALANAQGEMPSMPYLGVPFTGYGKIVCMSNALKYLIRCAMPEGTTLTANGTTYSGHHGIAPEWRNGPLSAANREWMTSCLLQHLNGYNTTTPLLLEGNRSGFGINTVPSGYPEFDSIMWGDLFSSLTTLDPAGWDPATSTPAFRASGCYFRDVADSCDSPGTIFNKKTCSGISCVSMYGRCETYCQWNTPDGTYNSSAYWTCGTKTRSFRERLPNFDMYQADCGNIIY